MIKKITTYTHDTIDELKKCSWPTFSEVKQATWLVLAVGLALALFIMGCDWVFSNFIQNI